MKIIILTSKGGEGLISGSKAIAEGLKQHYRAEVDVLIVDFFEKFGSIGRPFTRFYNLLLRKSLWLNVYFIKVLHLLRVDTWHFLYRKIHPNFKLFLDKENPDAIVITSQYVVSYISHYKENYECKTKIFVGNIDPGTSCVSLWFGKNIDKHLIPTPECFTAYRKAGYSLDRAVQAKLVVRSQFKEITQVSKKTMREKYSLPLSNIIVLFTGSREGLGEFFPLIKCVIKETSVHCVVICGSNKVLRSKLLGLSESRLTVLGWTDKVHEYLRASDLVVSKPGKQTMKETIATHVPMISLCYPGVMDQEKGNLEYMRNRKILVEGQSRQAIIRHIQDFSKDSKLYRTHVNQLQKISCEIESVYIANLIWQELNK